jgi:hypothetical protein
MIAISFVQRSKTQIGWAVALFLFALAITGCGGKSGKVSGQVMFQGKPLPGGVITFRPVDTKRNPVTATIDPNGNYEASVPAGEVKVSVDNRVLKSSSGPAQTPKGVPGGAQIGPPKDSMGGAGKDRNFLAPPGEKPPGTYVPIPEKYYDTESSGLSLTVKGNETYNPELK